MLNPTTLKPVTGKREVQAEWRSVDDHMSKPETFTCTVPLDALLRSTFRVETEGPRAWFRTGTVVEPSGIRLWTPKDLNTNTGEREWRLKDCWATICGGRAFMRPWDNLQSEVWVNTDTGASRLVHTSRLDEVDQYQSFADFYYGGEQDRIEEICEHLWAIGIPINDFFSGEIRVIVSAMSREEVNAMWSRGVTKKQASRAAEVLLNTHMVQGAQWASEPFVRELESLI